MTQHTIENDLATTRRNLDWWFTYAKKLEAELKEARKPETTP